MSGRCYACCQENCGYSTCGCDCHVVPDLSSRLPALDPDTRKRRMALQGLKHTPVKELVALAQRAGINVGDPVPCKQCGLIGAHFCTGKRNVHGGAVWVGGTVSTGQCPDHKRYQAKRKPRVPCEGCWRIWIALNPR